MRLCAYRVSRDVKAGLWVEQPSWKAQRPMKIVESLNDAWKRGEALELAFESWP